MSSFVFEIEYERVLDEFELKKAEISIKAMLLYRKEIDFNDLRESIENIS